MSLASGNYSIQNVATGRFVGLFFESIGHGAPIIGLPFEDASQTPPWKITVLSTKSRYRLSIENFDTTFELDAVMTCPPFTSAFDWVIKPYAGVPDAYTIGDGKSTWFLAFDEGDVPVLINSGRADDANRLFFIIKREDM